MKYHRPNANDFQQIVDLHNKNMITVLDETEKLDGFLSAVFSADQFKAMNDDLCVVTCIDDDKVCGYVCASSIEFNKSIPLVSAMIDEFPNMTYQGKSLATFDSFIYGPVCIDKPYRGKGILKNLLKAMFEILMNIAPQLELLIVLISSENKRSINAHKKIDMDQVGEFEFNQKKYIVLVLPITSSKVLIPIEKSKEPQSHQKQPDSLYANFGKE